MAVTVSHLENIVTFVHTIANANANRGGVEFYLDGQTGAEVALTFNGDFPSATAGLRLKLGTRFDWSGLGNNADFVTLEMLFPGALRVALVNKGVDPDGPDPIVRTTEYVRIP